MHIELICTPKFNVYMNGVVREVNWILWCLREGWKCSGQIMVAGFDNPAVVCRR